MRPFTLPKQLQTLTEEQLNTVNEWLDELKYEEIIPKLLSDFGVKMSMASLCRYQQKRQLASDLLDREEDMSEISILLNLLNGKSIPYDQAGIELVMKKAFELAATRKATPANLATLLRVFHYRKNCEWNERRLTQNDERIAISNRLAKIKETRRNGGSVPAAVGAEVSATSGQAFDADGNPTEGFREQIRARVRAKFGEPVWKKKAAEKIGGGGADQAENSAPAPTPTVEATLAECPAADLTNPATPAEPISEEATEKLPSEKPTTTIETITNEQKTESITPRFASAIVSSGGDTIEAGSVSHPTNQEPITTKNHENQTESTDSLRGP